MNTTNENDMRDGEARVRPICEYVLFDMKELSEQIYEFVGDDLCGRKLCCDICFRKHFWELLMNDDDKWVVREKIQLDPEFFRKLAREEQQKKNYEKCDNVWKCKECKAIIRNEKNLEKHLKTKSHLTYRERSDTWKRRQGIEPVFKSLLNPNITFERK